jgi:hypothetical protein
VWGQLQNRHPDTCSDSLLKLSFAQWLKTIPVVLLNLPLENDDFATLTDYVTRKNAGEKANSGPSTTVGVKASAGHSGVQQWL